MKKIYTILILMFVLTISKAQTITVSGTIAANTTWAADTVKITGDITVDYNAILTINPHTYVEFQGYYSINVNGIIHAIGSITDTITFGIKDTIGYSNTGNQLGGWNTIALNSSPNDTTIFEYCKFSYSKNIAIGDIGNLTRIEHCLFYNNLDGLNIQYSSNILISFNTIVNNSSGLSVDNSVAEISNNIISHNRGDGITLASLGIGSLISNNQIIYNYTGIYIVLDTNSVISNNQISFNSNQSAGAGIVLDRSSSKIIDNIITHNTSEGGSGIFISNYSSPSIIFNKIANNYGTGGGCGYTDGGAILSIGSSSPIIINNVICNNETNGVGGGIAINDHSSGIIVNNTIANNIANYSLGGGGLCLGFGFNDSNSVIKNNVVWGNQLSTINNQIYADYQTPFNNIDYCDFADTINYSGSHNINYQNLIMSNPMFTNPSAGAGVAYDGLAADWSLQPNSPCINAGTPNTTGLNLYNTDITGNARIAYDTIDMGAYEFNLVIENFIKDYFIDTDITISPNPFTSLTTISFSIEQTNTTIKITDILGKEIKALNFTGKQCTIEKGTMQAGIYFVQITTTSAGSVNENVINRKIVIQ